MEDKNLKRKLEESNVSIDISTDKLIKEQKNESSDQKLDDKNLSTDNSTNDDSKKNPCEDINISIGDPSNNNTNKKLKTTLYDNSNMSLSLIDLKKVIDIRFTEKSAILEGEYNNERALIFIEKLPFDKETIEQLFDEPFELTKILQNDVYGSFSLEPKIQNRIKTTIICPATDRHFEKYLRSQYVMIEETEERYKNITLPYLEENKFDITWVYNILEHKQEAERIVYEDEDEKNGFVLLPDLKWDNKTVKKLYLVAIVKRRDIKSIRDLTADHLPLLRNIKAKGCKTIKEKYGIDSDQLQIYFHYQPSYYHLHIHFNTIHFEHPRLYIGSSHLLDCVISNLEIDSNYYKKATITFRLKASNGLNEYYKSKLRLNDKNNGTNQNKDEKKENNDETSEIDDETNGNQVKSNGEENICTKDVEPVES